MDEELCPGLQRLPGHHAPDAPVQRVEEVSEPAVGPEAVIHLVTGVNNVQQNITTIFSLILTKP